jgi:hypothetical protein
LFSGSSPSRAGDWQGQAAAELFAAAQEWPTGQALTGQALAAAALRVLVWHCPDGLLRLRTPTGGHQLETWWFRILQPCLGLPGRPLGSGGLQPVFLSVNVSLRCCAGSSNSLGCRVGSQEQTTRKLIKQTSESLTIKALRHGAWPLPACLFFLAAQAPWRLGTVLYIVAAGLGFSLINNSMAQHANPVGELLVVSV